MELGPKRPSPLWFWGPNSILVVYMDPLGSKVRKQTGLGHIYNRQSSALEPELSPKALQQTLRP